MQILRSSLPRPLSFAIAGALSLALPLDAGLASASSAPALAAANVRRGLNAAPSEIARTRASFVTVTSCDDSFIPSYGELRYFITYAGSFNRIYLPPDLPCSTITLSAGALQVPNVPVTLYGPIYGGITIKSGGSDRVFASDSPDLVIEDLVIDGGQALADPDSRGGTIATGGSVTLINSTVSGGTARLGGCIYAYALTLQNSIVKNCNAIGYTGDASHPYVIAAGGGILASIVTLSAGSLLDNNKAAGTIYQNGYRGAGGSAAVTGSLTCSDSTIHGSVAPTGAAVSGGALSLTRCTVDANAYFNGGAALQGTSATVTESTVSGSYAGMAVPGTSATITRSLFSGNKRGVDVSDGYALIVDSTLSGNAAGIYGSNGNVAVVSSTVAGNFYGVFFRHSNMTARSSIFAANAGGGYTDVYFGPYREGNLDGADNLIVATNAFFAPGVVTVTTNPLLLPLADNGGPTLTHALQPGSPAIDKGNNAAQSATDQRGTGYVRAFGRPDIGAFEVQVVGDEILYAGFD